jgi:hypothetical protein
MMGPAAYLTTHALIQAEIDSQPERFQPLPAVYGRTEYRYLKIDTQDECGLYPNLDAAVEGENPTSTFPGGFSYAAYQHQQVVDGRIYYQLYNHYWLRQDCVQEEVTPTLFRGVLLTEPPSRPFGWILLQTDTHTRPGWSTPLSSNTFTRYQLVEVFEARTLGGYEWYRVGPDDGLEQRRVGLVFPRQTAPGGLPGQRWIELNLFEQTTAVYQDGQLIFATLTTSGAGKYYTRPGLFRITEKLDVTHMTGGDEPDGSDRYYLQNVPWTMYFDQRRAFHAEYWHDHLGYRSSHGCANLSFADAEWLYQWAQVEDWVYVWDPSGQTPVRPELFTNLLDAEGGHPTRRSTAE